MIAIWTASRWNQYTRQERLWVFLIVTMIGILPANLLVDGNWKLMAAEDRTVWGRRLSMLLLWLLLQAVTMALFACFERLAKAQSHTYCARCALAPTFLIAMVIFLGTLFDPGFMECGSAWQTVDASTRGSPTQFYGETGLDVPLEECQSYCGAGCGGVMHYQAPSGSDSGSDLVSGCKLCAVATWSNITANASNEFVHCAEKNNPGCPTQAYTLYSRSDKNNSLGIASVSDTAR